ncbi:hypothetical protein Tco_0345411 [Tanacetum coccineum]
MPVAAQQPYILQPSYEPPAAYQQPHVIYQQPRVIYQQPPTAYQQPPDRPTSPDLGFVGTTLNATSSLMKTEKLTLMIQKLNDAPTASSTIFMAKMSHVWFLNWDEVVRHMIQISYLTAAFNKEILVLKQELSLTSETNSSLKNNNNFESRQLNERIIITEYLVNISKRRTFWSLNEDILKITFDYQYAISIKEDTTYPCLHSPKTTKETSSIRRIQRRPIRRIQDIVCEYSGRYQTWSLLQETPIRQISIQDIEDLKQQLLDEMKTLINEKDYRSGRIDIEIKINELKENFNEMSIEINKKKKLQQLEQVANLSTYPSRHFNSFCYNDDDDEEYTISITPKKPVDSLIMEDKHLDTI